MFSFSNRKLVTYLAIVDLSTVILLDGKMTGSIIRVDMMGSKKLSGASESSNSSSFPCCMASSETFCAILFIPTINDAPPILATNLTNQTLIN